MTDRKYSNPQGLRQAITDRVRAHLADHHGQLQDVLRQFAYDRLLTRVFTHDHEGWILKGATAILARLGGQARHSLDIDLSSDSESLDDAEKVFRGAAAVDLDDYFRFIPNPGTDVMQGGRVRRIPVVAYLGATEFTSFHVDIVLGHPLTGEPDFVSPLVPAEQLGLVETKYRAYPVVDHIADKVCGLIERHPRGDGSSEGSTRYRDIADLVVFARTFGLRAKSLRAALESEASRRKLALPASLSLPQAPGWTRGYARVARDVHIISEKDLDTAMNTINKLLGPVLRGSDPGSSWDPVKQAWSGGEHPTG